MSVTEHVRLTVYIRLGCHLCDDMLYALNQITQDWLSQQPAGIDLTIQTIDIDEDPDLRAEYTERVPVLTMDDRFICEYFLDAQALHATLEEVLNGI